MLELDIDRVMIVHSGLWLGRSHEVVVSAFVDSGGFWKRRFLVLTQVWFLGKMAANFVLINCELGVFFGRNLKTWNEIRGFNGAFGLYSKGIRRLGQKIESRKISDFWEKWEILRDPLFLPSL
jgi:hypothetical protein